MSQKKFIDYIVNDRIKLLIDEFLEDLQELYDHYKPDGLVRYTPIYKKIEKWEAKKNE